MIGHDHKAVNEELIAQTGAFQDFERCITTGGSAEVRLSSVAGEGDEVRPVGLVETIESPVHRSILSAGQKRHN